MYFVADEMSYLKHEMSIIQGTFTSQRSTFTQESTDQTLYTNVPEGRDDIISFKAILKKLLENCTGSYYIQGYHKK